MSDVDVVIAGGGPVGLMLAGELGLAGVGALVLERAAERDEHSRAWGLHPRTAETLDRRGLLAGLLHERATWPKMPFAGMWPLLDLSAMRDCDHPYLVNVPQTRVEEVLAARAARVGAEVRRGHEVTGLAQHDDGVDVEVAGPGGAYRVRGRFLVGCDGGRSAVRKLAGIGFPGSDATVAGMLCDCTLPTMRQERRGITRTGRGTVNLNPRPNGQVRVVVTEFDRPHADRDAPVALPEFAAAVTRVLGRELRIEEPTWFTRFGDTCRQADRYRAGRVLLAGDAAHVHFPYGGLGLNLGLQDAVNLGWKLAAEVAGHAPAGLLDTYQAERYPVAEGVLDYSRTQLALLHPHRNVTALRGLVQRLLEFPEVNRFLAELVTGVALRLDLGEEGAHPLVGALATDLRLESADGHTTLVELLRAGTGVLVDFTQSGAHAETARPWEPRVQVRVARADAPPAAALLVRPDGYVAWAATDGRSDGPRAALERWFGT
ncbi:FAD-dependent monooxygenase [Saccharothrix australiensis]|uniref:Anhydrotetracycline monooxygenase/monooxygenase n=1 Tax=Saccharothrix australiensis TaxID=2072 RepID=A0A495W2F6_9PSEU|nr:FAD-dependent monooxygenase [Saccharothrix australiensis]RKT55649.1 anhydrotetracycline monooxygenase/monooxygenase [Saccharothrix australiensis]